MPLQMSGKGMFQLKIYLKTENGRRIFIPAPIWLLKTAMGMGLATQIAGRHLSGEQLAMLESIDFRKMKDAFDVLKRYKGLTMVDIKAKDGTEVRIEI